ncbi:MAG: amino acid adenylation domain-containing protein [Pseudomonadota bacterium]
MVTALIGERSQEGAWVDVLAQGLAPASFPLDTRVSEDDDTTWQTHPLPRFEAALARVAPVLRALRSRSAVAAWAVRVHRTQAALDLAWWPADASAPATGSAAAAPVVPLRCPPASLSFTTFEAAFAATAQRLQTQGNFALDLYERAPGLQSQTWPARWPWALWVADAAPETGLACCTDVVVWLSTDGSTARLRTSLATPSHTADALDAQLAALTAASLDAPWQSVAQLPLLDDAQRERLLVTWNTTAEPMPEASIHQLFEAQARRTPDAPALCFGTTRLTYAELDARAGQWACRLRTQGVGCGDRVALAVQRSVEMVVGLLAILKAGAAYVPVDCQQPPARINALLARSKPRLVLTHAAARSALAASDTPRLCFDADAATQARPWPFEAVNPNDLAYVIFTSGSTGEPKGVEIRHRSLVNHAVFMARHYGLGPGSRMLCSASIGFDVAAEQIYPALLSGAEVVVRPDDLLDTFQRFDRFVRQQALTALVLPTAFWHEWVRDLESRRLTVPPSLQVLCVGTEKAFGSALQSWRERGGQRVRFLQGYGPTESTITCTVYLHDEQAAEPLDPQAPLPIGRPLPNTQVYLLDEDLQPVPIGLPGELFVAGAGLARGYLDRPDLTAERFVPNPFATLPGERMYRSGDMARYQPDGQLVYIGRVDFQIKLRGVRMEPAEIEAVLRAHPVVQECLVMVREDTQGLPQLVAYLVGDVAAEDLSLLQQRCAAQLPAAMQPAAYVVLRAFPLNGNGKVDRAGLPPPAAPAPLADEHDALPLDAVEQILAGLFAQVLGRPSVSRQSSFFDLGGNSLRAVRLLSCVEAQFSVSLSLSDLLAHPTVAALARRIGEGSIAPVPTVIELKPGVGTPVFLVAGCPVYQALAQAYPGPEPVYAVLLPVEDTLLREGTPLPSLRVLAGAYLDALRAHTPRGPYVLGGLSFGGVVAYEMAQRLRAEGEPVPLLALIDSILPRARRRDVLAGVRSRLGQLLTRLAEALGKSVDAEARRAAQMNARRQHEIRRVLAEHDPLLRPYAGPTVLYRALDTRLGRGRPGHGFRALVPQLTEREMPGDHLSMLGEVHAAQLASELAQRVQAATPAVLEAAAPPVGALPALDSLAALRLLQSGTSVTR